MQFMPQKAIKGQDAADFLADHPVLETSKLYDDLPDEIAEVNLSNVSSKEQVWQIFFDGASRTSPEGNIIAGVGVVLIFPLNYVIPRAFLLTELRSNNILEYNALLIGMQLTERLKLKIWKHTVTQSSSSIRFVGSTKSNMKTWCPITMRLLS